MSNQMFHCGDIVKGLPKYSDVNEHGVVVGSLNGQYSVNWEFSGSQSWFEEDELELIKKCLIQVRKTDIY